MSVILAIIVFGIVVLVHEGGHFIAARQCGILVEEFAMGMGPKLFSFQKGDTLYSIRLFPIGGFCKMLGEDGDNNDPRAFNNKKVWQRIIVIIAGVVMNFILAIVVLSGFFAFTDITHTEIGELTPNYPAQLSGLLVGDKIVKIDNKKINIFEDLTTAIDSTKGNAFDITILRDNETLIKNITPVVAENNRYVIGIRPAFKAGPFSKNKNNLAAASLGSCINQGFYTTIFYVKATVVGISELVTLKTPVSEMAGPIGLVQFIGQSNEATMQAIQKEEQQTEISLSTKIVAAIYTVIQYTFVLSTSLAVFNLLPFPAMDGGRLVFLLIEGVRGKPINQEKEGMVHLVGFVLLMCFAVFVAYSDITKIMH